ncbi:MAG: hypothetical protein LBH73_09140, partial [Spirochaetaceae bacterium]|nr:hypothetical protein [Spirochaetaceae bacterium]
MSDTANAGGEDFGRASARMAAFVPAGRIAALLFAALGALTALVLFLLVREQYLGAAEGNFSANTRFGEEAGNTLFLMRSNTLSLLDMLDAASASPHITDQALQSFFERNQDIAAVLVSPGREYCNSRFFLTHKLDSSLAASFLSARSGALERCRLGQSLLLNAAQVFGMPVLVFLFPWRGEGVNEVAALFFVSEFLAPQALSGSFQNSAGRSSLVSDSGEALSGDLLFGSDSPDMGLFVQSSFEGDSRSFQTLYTGPDGKKYFAAFHGLFVADAAALSLLPLDAVYRGIWTLVRRIIFFAGALYCLSLFFVWLFSRHYGGAAAPVGAPTPGDAAETADAAGGISGGGGEKPFQGAAEISAFFSAVPSLVSEKLAPAEAAGLLKLCLDRVAESVEKTGGTVAACSGGTLTAVWRTPPAGTPAAFNAVRSALILRLSLAESNRASNGSSPRLRAGCGIAMGPDIAATAALYNEFFGTDILITENIRDHIGKYLIIEEMPPLNAPTSP